MTSIHSHWNFTSDLKLYRNVANYIYFTSVDNQEAVLRLSPINQRTSNEISSELEWMTELQKKNINTAEIILSKNQKHFETVSFENHIYHATVFKKIVGTRIDKNNISESIVIKWSKALAHLQLNTTFDLKAKNRPLWIEDSVMKKVLSVVDESTPDAKVSFLNCIQELKSKSMETNFGLIHADFHTGNFFMSSDKLTIFDFDDSCFHWFLYDLTIPILSIFELWDLEEKIQLKQELVQLFLDQYFTFFKKIKTLKKKYYFLSNYVICLFIFGS